MFLSKIKTVCDEAKELKNVEEEYFKIQELARQVEEVIKAE